MAQYTAHTFDDLGAWLILANGTRGAKYQQPLWDKLRINSEFVQQVQHGMNIDSRYELFMTHQTLWPLMWLVYLNGCQLGLHRTTCLQKPRTWLSAAHAGASQDLTTAIITLRATGCADSDSRTQIVKTTRSSLCPPRLGRGGLSLSLSVRHVYSSDSAVSTA